MWALLSSVALCGGHRTSVSASTPSVTEGVEALARADQRAVQVPEHSKHDASAVTERVDPNAATRGAIDSHKQACIICCPIEVVLYKYYY